MPNSMVNNTKRLSFLSVQNTSPDRRYYIKDQEKKLRLLFSNASKKLYRSLSTTFSMDQIGLYDFQKYIWPVVSSGVAITLGELVSRELNLVIPGHMESQIIFKFVLGASILSYSAAHRITEHRLQTTTKLSVVVASEVLAITYLYFSVFRGSQIVLKYQMPETYALINSLGLSSLIVPATLSYLVRKLQEKVIKKKYEAGSQRQDTALISSGLTAVTNTFFQANHFLLSEMATLSRLFQVALIFHNVLNAPHLFQQFRNLPALFADVGPVILKTLLMQQAKIAADYNFNTTQQKVLRFTNQGPQLIDVERHQLKKGDLVACDKNFELDSVPVTGEIVSLNSDNLESKISINLKAYNGEDTWIEYKTNTTLSNPPTKVNLHEIHAGHQAAVLVGAKLNLHGGQGFYVRIQDQTERTFSSNYVKKAVINQIVSEHKQRQVIYAIGVSLGLASLQSQDFKSFSTNTFRLLFNLSQMMIPFAETFLREMVNSRLMKDINQNLVTPIETIDALRVVDFFNTLSGYYANRFPRGVAIISDKTGTLTTTGMNVLGCWTHSMAPQVPAQNKLLLPEKEEQWACFEVFAMAFTQSTKALEPEEFAILNMFQDRLESRQKSKVEAYLEVDNLGHNHYRKHIKLPQGEKLVETFHLGLHRSLGGRFTLVDAGNIKYLVFCGIPKADKFHNTPLLQNYTSMNVRTGVLSRDWCVARAELSEKEFDHLKQLFNQNINSETEAYLCSDPTLIEKLQHFGTFLIDNPVKHGVEKFISNCRGAQIPVFIATGDTLKSAENIAKVLYIANKKNIIPIRQNDTQRWRSTTFSQDSTIIFAGINPGILELFQQIINIDSARRPVVIFAEMSTENKGALAQFLKNQQFFVLANGDGSNDVAMMRNAHMVIAHVTDEGTYAPGVQQFVDLSDQQLNRILNSDRSFYELFDIHQSSSAVMRIFTPLANSQEKPSLALLLKGSKMSFELARAMKIPVSDIRGLHWWGVAFDLVWMWFAFDAINATTDLPMDNQSLDVSHFSTQCLTFTLIFAGISALVNYALSGESTNLTWMIIVLSCLPVLLRSLFSGFGHMQEEQSPPPQHHGIQSMVGSFFQPNKAAVPATQNPELLTIDDKNHPCSTEFAR